MWLACPLVGWFPVGGMGAVDEDEVSLLDRFGESAREEEQDCFEGDGDTSPGFWRSWAGRLPGGRRPSSGAGSGEGSAGRPPPGPAGRYGIWTDSIPRSSITSVIRQVISSFVSSESPVACW